MLNAQATRIICTPRVLPHAPSARTTAAGVAGGFASTLAKALAKPRALAAGSPLVDPRSLFGGSATVSGFTMNLPAPVGTRPTPAPFDPSGSGAQPLDSDPISTYQGDRFSQRIELGQPVYVGNNIDQFHFPHIIQKDGTYYAYFIDHSDGSPNDVGLATSKDGVNWDYKGKVLKKGEQFDALQASFPAVQYDRDTDTWYMLYEAKAAEDDVNSVCLATSKDGLSWTKQGPVIQPGDAGEISDVDVGTPTMFKENGTWNVYFHTYADDGRVRIGYASGPSLDRLQVRQGAILDVDPSGIEGGTVGARSNVVKAGGWYYMAYEVCSPTKEFSDAQWGTNLARAKSPDGPWEKMDGPLISRDTPGFGEDGPELVARDDGVYLYLREGGNRTQMRKLTGLGATGAVAAAHQQSTPPATFLG